MYNSAVRGRSQYWVPIVKVCEIWLIYEKYAALNRKSEWCEPFGSEFIWGHSADHDKDWKINCL